MARRFKAPRGITRLSAALGVAWILMVTPWALAGAKPTRAASAGAPDAAAKKSGAATRSAGSSTLAARKTAAKPPAPRRAASTSHGAAASAAPDRAKPKAPVDSVASAGAISVGHPHAGLLLNAAQMPRSSEWVLTVPSHAYGTEETLEGLQHCIKRVHEQFPDTPPVMLGSISSKEGGKLPPHQSHRTGRDADVYFYRIGGEWVQAAKRDEIDYPRTWALLRCFVTETDVDFVLIDGNVQGWIEHYAGRIGEDPEWLKRIFHDGPGYHRAVIRHVPGHVAHMHVRFVSPKARQRGVVRYDEMVRTGRITPGIRLVSHRVAKGDALSLIAKRYRTTVRAMQTQNTLKGTLIRVGQVLKVPQPADLRGAKDPIAIPGRQLPAFNPPEGPAGPTSPRANAAEDTEPALQPET